jgi:hypothetical protein
LTPAPSSPLETALSDVEHQLAALGQALVRQDAAELDAAVDALQAALRGAFERFAAAAREGRVPAALGGRLARARGQVGAQREAFARARADVEQHLEILLPKSPAGASVYSPEGGGRGGPGRMLGAS